MKVSLEIGENFNIPSKLPILPTTTLIPLNFPFSNKEGGPKAYLKNIQPQGYPVYDL